MTKRFVIEMSTPNGGRLGAMGDDNGPFVIHGNAEGYVEANHVAAILDKHAPFNVGDTFEIVEHEAEDELAFSKRAIECAACDWKGTCDDIDQAGRIPDLEERLGLQCGGVQVIPVGECPCEVGAFVHYSEDIRWMNAHRAAAIQLVNLYLQVNAYPGLNVQAQVRETYKQVWNDIPEVRHHFGVGPGHGNPPDDTNVGALIDATADLDD